MKKQTILVLEDDRTSRKLLVGFLERAGYNTIEAMEGRDAIDIALKHSPAAMVVDVMLPDMSGTAVVEELSSKADCKYLKYIFLTGLLKKKPEGAKLSYLFDVAGKQYNAIPKPVNKDALTQILSKLLDEAEAERKADEEALAQEKAEIERRIKEKREQERLAAEAAAKVKEQAEQVEDEFGQEIEETPLDAESEETIEIPL